QVGNLDGPGLRRELERAACERIRPRPVERDVPGRGMHACGRDRHTSEVDRLRLARARLDREGHGQRAELELEGRVALRRSTAYSRLHDRNAVSADVDARRWV